MVSDEEPDFMREISISSEAKFLELHEAILDSVNYDGGAITSFFICNDDWEKEQEITLIEMDTDSDVDSYVMSDTTISDLVTDEHQKLLYVFDFLSDRAFFIELKEMLPGQDIDAAECTASSMHHTNYKGQIILSFVTYYLKLTPGHFPFFHPFTMEAKSNLLLIAMYFRRQTLHPGISGCNIPHCILSLRCKDGKASLIGFTLLKLYFQLCTGKVQSTLFIIICTI